MATENRPLSPHLDVYRLPLTALISITHRITGIGLTAGAILLVCWLNSAANGPESYASMQGFLGSWFGLLLLLLFSFAMYFHLCNGIRHLYWDMGHGLDLPAVEKSAKLVLIGTVVLTLLTWIFALAGGIS